MPIRISGITCISLGLLPVFLAGCESQPAVGPLPVHVVQAPATPSPAPATAPSPAAASMGGTFSLPIGAPLPPSAAGEPAPSSPAPAPFSIPPLAQQPHKGQQPEPATPAPSRTSTPSAAPGRSIHLSAGIAVPQILPIGTVMAISVDYSLNIGLNTSSRYFLVVKSGAGESPSEVQLASSGNLSIFFEQLKPEHRPFSVRIEEVTPGSNRRAIISNEVTLQTNY